MSNIVQHAAGNSGAANPVATALPAATTAGSRTGNTRHAIADNSNDGSLTHAR